MIWRDRQIRYEEGVIMLSHKGQHDRFDSFADSCPEMAIGIAGDRAEIIDEDRLRIFCHNGKVLVMTGDDPETLRVAPESP